MVSVVSASMLMKHLAGLVPSSMVNGLHLPSHWKPGKPFVAEPAWISDGFINWGLSQGLPVFLSLSIGVEGLPVRRLAHSKQIA